MPILRKHVYFFLSFLFYIFYYISVANAENITAPTGSEYILAYEGRFTPVGDVDGGQPQSTTNEKLAFYDKWLPIFGQRIRAKGIELPLPFTVGFNFFHADSYSSLVNFQDSHGTDPLANADYIKFDPNSRISVTSKQMQLSAWVFPFLNVFGIIGQNNVNGPLGITIDEGGAAAFVLNKPDLCNHHIKPGFCGKSLHVDANFDTNSIVYAFGAAIATDYKNFMFTVPFSYSFTQLKMSEDASQTINITPRIGYHFRSSTYGMLTPFIGGTYQHTDININGYVPAINANYSIDSDVDSYYSTAVGIYWMPKKRLNFDFEYNIGPSRETFMINALFSF